MTDASASLVRCDVRLTDTHLYPGDAVEGSVVIDAAGAFNCGNIHVKVVGKESVSVLVDQVSQSKTPNLQYGISAQDYVYYREVVTLAGPLITQKNEGTTAALSAQRTGCSERGSNGENADADEGDAADVVLYNESVCVRPGVAEQNQCFAISQMAAEEGVSVRFPAGHFVYPFRFRLPDALPPSYDTGMCVKDGQHSNSQAALRYYVKVYVKSPARVELASARADFVVGAMQPVDSVAFPPVVKQQESTKRSTALKATASPSSRSSPSAPRGAAASEEKRCFVRQPSSSSGGRTVHCAFSTTGTCSCMSGGATLKVAIVTTSEACQIGRDCVAATCLIAANTTAKKLRGLKVELTQLLAFETAAARVTLRKTLLKAECATAVPVGEGGTMTAHTAILEPSSEFIPSMKTSGLEVRYVLRVQLIAPHVDGAFYEFDDVQLTGPVMAQDGKGAASPPVGAMSFTALPRGRLTRREAYYAVPAQPCETPVIAELAAPLSVQGSRAASRRASRLNTLSAEEN